MSQMKRCPFCGDEVEIVPTGLYHWKYAIRHKNKTECILDANAFALPYEKDDAIRMWNTRADRKTEPTISKMEQVDKPTTQTETQNSNLTFKTLEYCDICDHKGCKECVANALDEHCIPSQFKKQIEDECAKEYEELGLKELKELIEADRKTEPTISKMEQAEDEPQTERSEYHRSRKVCTLELFDDDGVYIEPL